jgi:HlyD family secretion protein
VSGRKAAASLLAAVTVVASASLYLKGSTVDAAVSAPVRRGTLAVTLTEAGILRSAESNTYRSPLEGRETEITYLAAEGSQVHEGDLLARFDTTGLKVELGRATQAARQTEMELQAADVERQEAALALESIDDGEGSLALDEARTNLRLADAKVQRLRESHGGLAPLLDKGYITRDELDRSALALDEAEASAGIVRRKVDVLANRTQPKAQKTATLQLARRQADVQNLRPKLEEARRYVAALTAAIDDCALYARRPGLVVYEQNFAAVPFRKIRVGDRVTPSQGLITLPDLRHMVVESSVREVDVHRVQPGQRVHVRVDAFPDLDLSGRVTRIRALAHGAADRPLEDKRFDLRVDVDTTDVNLRPDMNARVDILVAERRDVLLAPINAVFEHNGLPICYVLRRSGVETRVVATGESNDVDVEIVTGLREGDRVALTESRPVASP